MLTLQNAEVSLNSFREQSAGQRIVFFYPWAKFRLYFVSQFLRQERPEILFYRVAGDEETLPQMLAGLAAEFNQVLGNFGANVTAAVETQEPRRMAQALAADLDALHRPLIVYIDEFEKVTDGAAFLEPLVETLPENVQIALN